MSRCPELADYILAEQDRRKQFFKTLKDQLAARRRLWGVADLEEIGEEVLQDLAAGIQISYFTRHMKNTDVCGVITLNGIICKPATTHGQVEVIIE